MQAIYQANIEELDEKFLQGLKVLFKGKQVNLIVSEVSQEQAQWNNLLLAQQQSLNVLWDNQEDEIWNTIKMR
ncbi:MAG: hypothetical protein WAX77_03380 [Methylococcaceae bacterium]